MRKNFSISEKVSAFLTHQKKQSGRSMSALVSQAVLIYKILLEHQREDGTIRLVGKDGEEVAILL